MSFQLLQGPSTGVISGPVPVVVDGAAVVGGMVVVTAGGAVDVVVGGTVVVLATASTRPCGELPCGVSGNIALIPIAILGAQAVGPSASLRRAGPLPKVCGAAAADCFSCGGQIAQAPAARPLLALPLASQDPWLTLDPDLGDDHYPDRRCEARRRAAAPRKLTSPGPSCRTTGNCSRPFCSVLLPRQFRRMMPVLGGSR